MAKLISSSRGSITLDIDGVIIEFFGEAYLPGYGSPDYEIYSNQVINKSTGEKITDDLLTTYLEYLKAVATEKGWEIKIT